MLLVVRNVIVRPADSLQALDIGMAGPASAARGYGPNSGWIIREYGTRVLARHFLDGSSDLLLRVVGLVQLVCECSHYITSPLIWSTNADMSPMTSSDTAPMFARACACCSSVSVCSRYDTEP